MALLMIQQMADICVDICPLYVQYSAFGTHRVHIALH